MNREQFIEALRKSLYGKISEQELMEHLRYYEAYFDQEIRAGRREEEILAELGDPRLIAKTILGTSEHRAARPIDTIEEESEYANAQMNVHTLSGWKATLVMALLAAAVILLLLFLFGLAVSLLPILAVILVLSWLLKRFLR